MVNLAPVAKAIVADPALLEKFFEDVEIIVQATERIANAARAMTEPPPSTAAAQSPSHDGSAKVFDTSVNALEQYDAETLVALRKDHSLVDHLEAGCHICEILARRLGSAKP